MSKPLLLDLKEKSEIKILHESNNDEEILGEITLSENIKNFDYIEIIMGVNDDSKTIKVDEPNGKTFYENLQYASGNNHIEVFSKFAINGNKITPVTANCGYKTTNYLNSELVMHLDRTNYIRILKVIGGKYYEKNEEQ